MKRFLYVLLLVRFVGQIFFPAVALAQEASVFSTNESFATQGLSSECVQSGLCTPCELILVGVRIARFLLGISGAVSLLILVIAGVFFIASTGNQAIIDKSKAMIKAVIVGLIFVLFSWQIINLLLLSLVKPDTDNEEKAVTLYSGAVWTKIECTKIQ